LNALSDGRRLRRLCGRARAFWRDSVRRWWHDYEWPVVGALAVAALGFGCIGYARHFAGNGRSAWDVLYATLQLYILQMDSSVQPPVAWELNLARFLAPVVAGYTAVQALAELFAEQLQSLRLRLLRNHIVICGLGRKGLLLTHSFLECGERVVVIEQDEGNGMLQQCRDEGAIVVMGNASERGMLRKARIHRARYVVAVCGDDGANAEVGAYAREIVGRRRGRPLTCLIHIVDPELYLLLREQEMAAERVLALRLEFFNVFDIGARRLLNEHPIFSEACEACGVRPHILVVGLGQMGQSVVVHAAKGWRARHGETGERLRLTVLDPAAEEKRELWRLRYPQLETVCELQVLPMGPAAPQFHRAEFLRGVTTAYVCLDDDFDSLSAALSLHGKARGRDVTIVACMTGEAGLAGFLHGGDPGGFRNLRAFSLLERTCNPDLLPGGTHESLARLLHEAYVQHRCALGETPETNAALVPWDELPEDLKESNRLAADHIGVKLEAIGCGIAPLMDWDAESFRFTDAEVETMARLEHERYMAERLLEGWSWGLARDDREKRNPDLVCWERLPDGAKAYNRDVVRRLPVFLARAGFQVYRSG